MGDYEVWRSVCSLWLGKSPNHCFFQKWKGSILVLLLTSAADPDCAADGGPELEEHIPWQGDIKKSHVLGLPASCVQLDRPACASAWANICNGQLCLELLSLCTVSIAAPSLFCPLYTVLNTG